MPSRNSAQRKAWHLPVRALALFFLTGFAGSAIALTFGPPELESSFGERLRVVLPLVGQTREPLTIDCVKLRPSNTEPYEISHLIRATLIPSGTGQAVVLTTAQAMNEVVVSFEAAIGCGTWFSRRYTFFLDLPRERLVAPVPVTAAPEVPPAAATATAPRPKQRRRMRESGAAEINPPPAAPAPRSLVRRARPEDEPGVLPRANGRATQRPVTSRPRSLLTIDVGALDEILSPSRAKAEQLTGMRMASELGGLARTPSAVLADPEFKRVHARYLAAIGDQADPVARENAVLSARLDVLAKDIASLKIDLQSSAARAKEIEATRVSWWWLIAAALAAGALGAGMVAFLRRPPARQLILIDPDERPHRSRQTKAAGAKIDHAAAEPPAASPSNAAPTSALNTEAGRSAVRTAQDEAPDADSFERTVQFDSRKSALQAAAAKVALATSSDGSKGAAKASLPDINPSHDAPVAAPASLILDKNSLTQQLATMTDLSDEAWASYRHPSDSTGVAIPFHQATLAGGGGGAINPLAPQENAGGVMSIEINFNLDEDIAAHAKDVVQKSVLPALEFDSAAVAAASIASQAATTAEAEAEMFSLETIDLPAELLRPNTDIAASAFEKTAPSANQAILMQAVMAEASNMMEAAQRQWAGNSAALAMKTVATYLEAAPANAPPGPWVMLAHILHDVGMKRQYVELQSLFAGRFGAALPSWEDAYTLRNEQLGLARAPGIEIMAASSRRTTDLVGRLAGVIYRVDVPQSVLFDLQFHREVLQLVAECLPEGENSGDGIDLAL